MFWSEDMSFEVQGMSDQMISGSFTKDEVRINMCFVYAKCNQVDRRTLWQDIEAALVDDVP